MPRTDHGSSGAHRPRGRGVGLGASGRAADVVAGLLVRCRSLVVGVWVLVVVASVVWFPTITQARGEGVDGFVPAGSAAVDTEVASFEEFGFPLFSRTAIVQRDPGGLAVEVQAGAVRRAVRVTRREYPQVPLVLGALPVPNSLDLFPRSGESGTSVLTYLFTPPCAGFAEQYEAARRLVALSTGPGDAVVGVSGSIPARVEQARIVTESLPVVELATLTAIVGIVGVVFRSLVAPLLTVVVGDGGRAQQGQQPELLPPPGADSHPTPSPTTAVRTPARPHRPGR